MNVDKYMLSMGAGAGIGVVIPKVLEQYVEPTYGATIPGVDTVLPLPWSRWSVFIPIITGAGAFVISAFTNIVANKNKMLNDMLGVYGITSLTYGALNGVFSLPTSGARARAPVARARQIRPQLAGNGMTPTGISSKVIVA